MTERSKTQQLIDSFTGNKYNFIIYREIIGIEVKFKQVVRSAPCEIKLYLNGGREQWLVGRSTATDNAMIGLAITISNEVNSRY